MLRGAASALSRSADSAGVLVVGGLLTLLTWVVTPVWVVGVLYVPPLFVLAPLAFAPAFVARGYLVRVVADAGSTGNRDGAPSFVAWNDLYRDGIRSVLLSATLLAPLAALLSVVALAAVAVGVGLVDLGPAVEVAERALGPDVPAAVAAAAAGILVLVVAAYLLAFAYVRPAALAAFAASGRLRDGLRPRRIAAVAGSGSYATAWVVAAATLGVGYALAAPLVPLAVGVAFVFAVRIAAHALYGRGAAGAVAFDAAEPTEPPASVSGPESPVGVAESRPDRSGDAPVRSGDGPVRSGHAPGRFDGGVRPSASEASAAVQTGRTVPLDDDGDAAVDAGDAEAAVDAGGFRWSGESGPADDESLGDGATDDGFEWGAGVDPEDKS
jgi:hypothetical protein